MTLEVMESKTCIRYEIQSQSHKIAGRPGFSGYLIVKSVNSVGNKTSQNSQENESKHDHEQQKNAYT